MKQIELRLALVFYGGVSLAIYMHGVSREFLALLRASDRHRRDREAGGEEGQASRPLSPVERAYLRLFEALENNVDLRVVVDAIAGASAGGVNGVMLARAIAHDLPLDDHRALWLENADVTRLAKPQDGLSRYFKKTLSPVLDRLLASALKSQITNEETREKLRGFVQSRWFTPPFSGEKFSGWMLDACAAMDRHWRDGGCLLPRGQTLDLFVTVTDYFGQTRRIMLESPAVLEETEHRRILHFSATHRLPGTVEGDFGPGRAPDHVFAARATSSFPGAFPPATVAEMDAVLAARGEDWANRDAFVGHTLGISPQDPVARVFVDGSVVMNKPFAPVVEAIADRPAVREVVRRLVYVDPMPSRERTGTPVEDTVPGFFRVILASLAHIPRNEPIGDELLAIGERNRQARRIAELIAATDPLVEREVGAFLGNQLERPPTVNELVLCRKQANEAAHRQAGYARISYLKLKVAAVAERLAELVAGLAAAGGEPVDAVEIEPAIADLLRALETEDGEGADAVPARVVALLRTLDVDYRVRRLRFVIRRLNGLYHSLEARAYEQSPESMDELKTTLYEQIDQLVQRWSPDFYADALAREAADLVRRDAGEGEGAEKGDALEALLERLSEAMGLAELDTLHDDVFAVMSVAYLVPPLRVALTGAYVGFAFYDLVTLPVLQRNDYSEINETLVERISASDGGSLGGEGVRLKGTALNMFGAFFNRAWREHDYLWGRLNAADRLVSIVLAAVNDWRPDDLDEEAIRRDLFRAIVAEEAPHLKADPELLAGIEALIAGRFGRKERSPARG